MAAALAPAAAVALTPVESEGFAAVLAASVLVAAALVPAAAVVAFAAV